MEKIELIRMIDKLISMSDYLITDYIKSIATEKHIQTNNLYNAINEMLTEIINTLHTGSSSFFIDETGKTKFFNDRYTGFNIEQLDVLKKLKDNISIDNKTKTTFKDLLLVDDKNKQQIIDKIRLLPKSKPKDIFFILAALIEHKTILETEKSKIYTAFANEFNYTKSIKSLESSCNTHFAKRNEGDKGYDTQIKNTENHLFD